MPSPALHASCIALGGRGVLLLGVPGAGKSSLALRLIDGGGVLVADDAVDLRAAPGMEGGGLIASAPERLAGLIELRGLGIYRLPYLREVPLALAVGLSGPGAKGLRAERLPEPRYFQYNGLITSVREVTLSGGDPAAPALIRAALAYPRIDEI